MLHINYTDHSLHATADAEAKSRAESILSRASERGNTYFNTSSILVVDWLRVFIKQGKIKHTDVIFSYHNQSNHQTNKNGVFTKGWPFPEYPIEPLLILIKR